VAIAVLIVGSLVLVVAWVVQFFGAMRYVSILASRMPDEKLAARAKTYVWLLPLIYILGSCVVVGPLVAMILWAIMLMNIRSRLGEVLLEQQGMGPARGLA
jgi:sterol desaturase/sphingolipid hydroxylase (fatty acid hydroxylase superfamily)